MQKQEEQIGQIVNVKISDIKIGNRLRKKVRNIESLAKSMSGPDGLLHPILLDQDMSLIAGFRRVKAAEYLGWTEIPARILNIKNPKQAEWDENAQREDIPMTDVAAVFKAVQATRPAGRPSKKVLEESNKASNLDTFPKGSSLDVTASLTHYSHGQVAKMISITDASEQNPTECLFLPYDRSLTQLVEDVDNRDTSVDDAYKLLKKTKRSKGEELKSKQQPRILACHQRYYSLTRTLQK